MKFFFLVASIVAGFFLSVGAVEQTNNLRVDNSAAGRIETLADFNMNCDVLGNSDFTICCDNTVGNADCYPPLISGDLGKKSIGGQKTHTFRLDCNAGFIQYYHYGHSGGTTNCIDMGGAIDQHYVVLSCHNSAAKGGHVWINDYKCTASH